MLHVPEIRPITDLARNARRLIEGARKRQEPVIITQRGRDVAVLLPIELYRQMERRLTYRMVSPRLARPEDSNRFQMEVTRIDTPQDSNA